jgi:CheY-like chemotaxis protein
VKILIVEDNPVNAAMVRLSLEKAQYETVLAVDGAEALAKLEEHPEIDLVITDVMMPNVGGLEMLERIRQRPEWRMLPVVVATSLANQATVRQAVSLHCKHFIVKPFTVKLLVQTVREAIGQRGVVLQEKMRVLDRLGLDPDGYDQLALTFSTFVHERVGDLRTLCEPTGQAEASEQATLTEIDLPMRRDLFALEESAALLGAERLANLLIALGLRS